jgi:hypothetical protein
MQKWLIKKTPKPLMEFSVGKSEKIKVKIG